MPKKNGEEEQQRKIDGGTRGERKKKDEEQEEAQDYKDVLEEDEIKKNIRIRRRGGGVREIGGLSSGNDEFFLLTLGLRINNLYN